MRFDLLALALLALAAHIPALFCGFIWDDDAHVTNNASLLTLNGLWNIWTRIGATPQYYPLVHTTFWIERLLWGFAPAGYHFTNLILHAINAILVFSLLRRLDARGAWLAAALFAVHPVHVESVAWISERKNLLSGAFYLLAAIAYLRFEGIGESKPDPARERRRLAFAYGFFLCALLSKTVTSTLPAALAVVLWWKRGRIEPRSIRALAPMLLIGIPMGLLTAWIERHHLGGMSGGAVGREWDYTFAQRLLIAGRAPWELLLKLVVPYPLVFIYPKWPVNPAPALAWLFPVATVGAVAALWALRGRLGRAPLAAILLYGGTLFPALGFFNIYPMRYAFVADHYQYLASIAPIALAAAAWQSRSRAGLAPSTFPALQDFFRALFSPAHALPGVAIALFAALAFKQAFIYRDLKTLWLAVEPRNPQAFIVQVNLGTMAEAAGDLAEARRRYDAALKIDPQSPEALFNLGAMLERQGDDAEALRLYRAAAAADPKLAHPRYNIAMLFNRQGKGSEAIAELEAAIAAQPSFTQARIAIASILLGAGKIDDAQRRVEEAVALAPRDAAAQAALGAISFQRGDVPRAAEAFAAAAKLDPANLQAHAGLADALMNLGRYPESEAAYRRAIEINPSLALLRKRLGIVLAIQRKFAEAAEQFSAAIQLDPSDAESRQHLAAARRDAGLDP